MRITNYHVVTTGEPVRILTGDSNSTVIKSLELMAGSNEGTVSIYRRDSSVVPVKYGEIKVNLEEDNYLMLWEGFICIPSGHTLWIDSDVSGIEAVANVVEDL